MSLRQGMGWGPEAGGRPTSSSHLEMLAAGSCNTIRWSLESQALHGAASTPSFMLFPLPLTPFPATPAEKYPEKLALNV